jgi:Spy/CpxP family protein refolding chaperone
MNARTKSAVLLGLALLLGIVLGALASGTVFQRRISTIAEMRTSRGMAFMLEEVVQPESDAQRAAFRAAVDEMAPAYAEVFETTGEALRALNDSVIARVRPILTPEQTERLEEHLAMRRSGRLRPRRGGERRRSPGPRHDPPPDGP